MSNALIPPEAIPSVLCSFGVSVLVLLAMVLRLWRASRASDEPADDVVPVEPMPGVRVFDVLDSGTPLDVTNSRFETRGVRDARERVEAGHRGGSGR